MLLRWCVASFEGVERYHNMTSIAGSKVGQIEASM